MATSSTFLGAPASSAGDDFHELWVMRLALSLLDPASDRVDIKVEGVPADEAHRQVGKDAQAVDVAIRLRTAGGPDRMRYEQLKFSSSAPRSSWTWNRLLRPKAAHLKYSSVLGKLARLFLKTPDGASFAIVTNQPPGATLFDDVGRLIGLLDGTVPARAGDTKLIASLEQGTGLTGPNLRAFLAAWDLSGFGSQSRLRLETDALYSIGQSTDADARSDYDQLQQKIAKLMLPENQNWPPITRDTVLTWLGAGASHVLYPALSQISPPSGYVRRQNTDDLVAQLKVATRFFRLRADGGCGKTSLISSLGSELPKGSEVIVYDCYGGGSFLASDGGRHSPEDAFVQVANEIAGRLASPFVLRRGSSGSIAASFARRLDAAAKLLEIRSPDALLVIAFDAVDNARTASRHWKDECFLDPLLALSTIPANVRVLLSCRDGRADEVGPVELFDDFKLPPFEVEESRQFVAARRPAWGPSIADQMHDISGGNPRRLAYSLEGRVDERPEVAIERLMPRGSGVEAQFERLVSEAERRLGGRGKVDRMLCGLANLPRPVPGALLAELSGLVEGDIRDIANDIGGMIERLSGWTFQDEDFEFYADQRTRGIAGDVTAAAADMLFDRRQGDVYAARSVGEALMRAQQWPLLYQLVRNPSERPDWLGKVEARLVQSRRLTFALRCCREANDHGTAATLLIAAAEAIKSERLVNDLLARKGLALSARFAEEHVSRVIHNEQRYSDQKAALRVRLAAAHAGRDDAAARDHLRWWNVALLDRNLADEPDRFAVHSADIAAEFRAMLVLYGFEQAFARLTSWRPLKAIAAVLEIVAAEDGGAKPEMLLALISARKWPPAMAMPLLAAALATGADPSGREISECVKRLARTRNRAWRRDEGHAPDGALSFAEATLLACEMLSDKGAHPTAVAKIVDLAFPTPAFTERWDLTRFGSKADLFGRAVALREILTGTPVSVDDILPPRKEVRRAIRPKASRFDYEWHRPREKSDEENWNEARDEAAATLEQMLEAARTATSSAGPGEALHVPDYRRSHRTDGQGVFRFVRAWLIRNAAKPDFEVYGTAGRKILDDAGLNDPTRLVLLARGLSLAPPAHGVAISLLAEAAGAAQSQAAPASDRAGHLMAAAQAAMAIDPELAGNYFEQAIALTEKVDIEVLSQIELGAVIAASGTSGSEAEVAAAARLFADIAAGTEASLGFGGDFPWDAAIRGIAALHLPTALAALSQWRDIGLVSLERSLPPLLEEPCPKVTASQRQSLAILGAKELDPGQAYQGQAVPAAAIDEVARGALLTGTPSPVESAFNKLSNLVGAEPTPSYRRLETARDALALWRAPVEEVDETESAPPAQAELTDEALVRAALEELAADERHMLQNDLVALAGRVRRPNLRTAFLRQASALDQGSGWFGRALLRIFPKWSDYQPVQRWAASELPSYIARSFEGLFEYRYSDTSLVEELLAMTGKQPAEEADVILDAAINVGSLPSAELVYAIAAIVARRCDADARRLLFDELITNIASRLDQAPLISLAGISLVSDVAEAVARTLYAAMSDVDRRIRWRAAHAALMVLRLKDEATATALMACLVREHDPDFVPASLPFYVYAAREQLLTVALRASVEDPAFVSGIADPVLALLEITPHAAVRELARMLLLQLDGAGHLPERAPARADIEAMNRGRLAPVERLDGHFGGDRGSGKDRKFNFDQTDTIPYWYSTPAEIFAMPMDDFLDRVETWVHDKWGFVETDSHWLEEPRLDRLRDDHGLSDHRHGGTPTIERLSRYVEWHGMMCALGEMIDEVPLARPHDYFDWTWEGWLADQLPTLAPYWLCDVRTAPPLEARFWGFADGRIPMDRPDNEDDPWLRQIDDKLFDHELHAGDATSPALVVAGDYEFRGRGRQEHVSISTALVSRDSAAALAHALATARDPMDFRLPDPGDSHEFSEPGFVLKGWLHPRRGDPRSDKFDERRGTVNGLPVQPDSGLSPYPLSFSFARYGWIAAPGQAPSIALNYWGERDDAAESGWRATADVNFLQQLLRQHDLSMIFEVDVRRRLPDTRHRRRRAWRMFVLDPTGRLTRVDGRKRSIGRYFVHRLGLDYSVDTLSRWKLHRIEELLEGVGDMADADRARRQIEIGRLYASLRR